MAPIRASPRREVTAGVKPRRERVANTLCRVAMEGIASSVLVKPGNSFLSLRCGPGDGEILVVEGSCK
jgi:hypothetical protein